MRAGRRSAAGPLTEKPIETDKMRKVILLATVVLILPAAILIGCSRAVEEPGGTPEEMRAEFEREQAAGSAGAAAPDAANAEEEFGP